MDFRLLVFKCVAEQLSFTKAANELSISQPAISKHISELEATYKVVLFDRQGGKISLTREGDIFLKHVRIILECYDNLTADMSLLSGNLSGEIRIGASTTISQYLLPPLLADFITKFPSMKISIESGNSAQIEEMIEEHKIDLGMVEGERKKHNLKYSFYAKDELVLITSNENKCNDTLTLDDIKSIPLILRENGSGTLDVVCKNLEKFGLDIKDFNVILNIGSTEGIKRFLERDKSCFGIVSVISVIDEIKNGKLKIIDIEGVDVTREFSFVVRHGGMAERVDKFISFANHWVSNNIP